MKALIAVDGSAGGFEAVRQAGRLLAPGHDQIALYYSLADIQIDSASAIVPALIERARRGLGDAILAEALTYLPAELQPTVHKIIDSLPPSQGILAAANQWGAQVIVVGARGLGPIQKLLLGSVSQSVVHSAHVPVLVVRPEKPPSTDAVHVLLACPANDFDRYLAECVRAIAWPPATVGRVMSVVEPMFAGEIPAWLEKARRSPEVEALAQAWVDEHKQEIAARREVMKKFCGELPAAFQTTEPIVTEGHPADQILNTAIAEKANLVIVGAPTSGTMARLLLGSTSEAVINHALCSVLVVRHPKEPGFATPVLGSETPIGSETGGR